MSIDDCCDDTLNDQLAGDNSQKPFLGFKKIDGGVEHSCYNSEGELIISTIYKIPERIWEAAKAVSAGRYQPV